MISIFSISLEELIQTLVAEGYPKYRGKQVFEWIYDKKTHQPMEMKNLPIQLRRWLETTYDWHLPRVAKEQVSKIDGTRKYLLRLEDGHTIEAVLMFHKKDIGKHRTTMCVSSQVGCAVSCPFCATGKTGLFRNLTVGEIVGQVLVVAKTVEKADNLVFMGMGEPLLNFKNLNKALVRLIDENATNFSARKVTVSTCGIVPGIYGLADTGLPVTLAISLHAADDQLRDQLVPINKKYPIQKVIQGAAYYAKKTGRKVTFEYILIRGVNDRIADAKKLASLLQGLLCNVNLIPANPVVGMSTEKPTTKTVQNFCRILQSKNIETVIRTEKGSDIEAACGQLKAKTTG